MDKKVTATKEESNWAVATHLSAFLGFLFPFANIIAPLVVWLFKKSDSKFIEEHAREALNFQISITIYAIISVILIFVLIGFFLLAVVLILELVQVIKAAVAASKGESYRYAFSMRLVK